MNNSATIASNTKKCILILFVSLLFAVTLSAKGLDYYQIKRYIIENEMQEKQMDSYLQNAYLPALHRAGISNVGVFKPIQENNETCNLIVVWIPFKSLKQFNNLQDKLNKDEAYQQDGSEYINAPYDQPPYQRIESVLLKAFTGMPKYSIPNHNVASNEKVYELRSYQSATELLYQKKVEMFSEAGEIEIFEDLGFQPLFFGEVISGPEMPNLIYMITFSNKESQNEHWKAFSNSPAWDKLKEVERYKNTVSHIDKHNLYPTDYSDF